MRVRHRWAAICATAVITVVTGAPVLADDIAAPAEESATVASHEPVDESTEPVEAPTDPVDTNTNPVDTTTEPVDATTEPVDATTEPVDATTEPVDATTEPADGETDAAPPPDHLVVQDIRVESIQVGVANTGDNLSTSDEPSAPSSGTPGATLDTGSASAVGSSDSTAIGQRAVTELHDEATAEIVQVSVVFNIGGALANSGDNDLTSGSTARGDGSITSGSASAVGNNAETYVTQGASGQADPGETDEVYQRTATLQIGLALANSGGNVISATLTTGGPATARTGNATAVGNLSSTTIDQIVSATGRGDAALHIEQRATVVNLGLAFAGTGGNLVGADFPAALLRGDEGALEQLLGLLLPVLFASTDDPTGAGAGTISTGNATSIGNRSSTSVLQVAIGEADSGSVGIRQDVVVVNAGVASATTGSNSIGAIAGNQRSLAPDAQAVVSQLAGFVRTLLADIDSWVSGSASRLGSNALRTAFGDFDIGIDQTVVAGTAGSSGSAVTTRQLAAVINLAVARANSGGNRLEVAIGEPVLASAFTDPAVTTALAAAGAGAVLITGADRPLLIVTGDASAANASVVVLCQRADLLVLDCLGPDTDASTPPTTTPPATTPSATTPPTATPSAAPPPTVDPAAAPQAATQPPVDRMGEVGAVRPSAAASTLPATGTDSVQLVLVALALLLFGSGLLVMSRHRT